MRLRVLFLFVILIGSSTAYSNVVDCSEVYEGKVANCEQITCNEKYQSFLGAWSGPMESLVDFSEPPKYRKYQNLITYSSADCLKNLDNGDEFIIGRHTDSYPEIDNMPLRVEKKLLITGKDNKGKPFLRTVDLSTKEHQSYDLIHKNDVAALTVWQIKRVRNGQPFTVETIDAQDWTVPNPATEHRRNVTVTLESGPFKRVLVRGYHTKQ